MTQPLGLNYGGIIQNYALQKILLDKGHQTITIKRGGEVPNSKIKYLYGKYRPFYNKYILQQDTRTFIDSKIISKNNRRFLKEHINLSPKLKSTSILSEYFKNNNFDAVVVGSDQVWRPKYSPNIFNFFLDFLKNDGSLKKVAYAASFGTEKWEYSSIQAEECSKLIQQFNAVSVREDSGVKLCSEYLNRKDAVHVLDPTILLDAEDYSKIIDKPKRDLGMFTYVLDETEEKLIFIDKCAINLRLKINRNQAKYSVNNFTNKDINDYIIPPIEGWLQGFRDAKFVITDSFHGTVFSILNQKPFLVLVNKSRGASRFESLLKKLGLENCLIYDVHNFEDSQLKQEIDYKDVFSKLKVLKIESMNFLSKYL